MQPLSFFLPPVSPEVPNPLPAVLERVPKPIEASRPPSPKGREADFSKVLRTELGLEVPVLEALQNRPHLPLTGETLLPIPEYTRQLMALWSPAPEVASTSEPDGGWASTPRTPEELSSSATLEGRENTADTFPLPLWLPLPLEVSVQTPVEHGPEPIELPRLPQKVLGQVMHTMREQQVVTHLDFQINPPALGPVNLQVSYTQGVVGVQLTALSLQAKHALESQLHSIQSTLLAHHLTPGSMRVVLATPGRAGSSGMGARNEGASTGFGGGHASRRRAGENSEDPVRSL